MTRVLRSSIRGWLPDHTVPKVLNPYSACAASCPALSSFFQADLFERGSYTRAMKDCRVVFHTASPFELAIRDPQRELIDSVVLGTRNVLGSVNITQTVRRVVLTSSMVAAYGDNADLGTLPGDVISEAA